MALSRRRTCTSHRLRTPAARTAPAASQSVAWRRIGIATTAGSTPAHRTTAARPTSTVATHSQPTKVKPVRRRQTSWTGWRQGTSRQNPGCTERQHGRCCCCYPGSTASSSSATLEAIAHIKHSARRWNASRNRLTDVVVAGTPPHAHMDTHARIPRDSDPAPRSFQRYYLRMADDVNIQRRRCGSRGRKRDCKGSPQHQESRRVRGMRRR